MTVLTFRRPGTAFRISAARLGLATAITAAAGLAATGLVYLLGLLSGAVDARVVLPSLIGMGPLSLTSVWVTTLAAIAAAGILIGVLSATTRRPVMIFRIVATVLAPLSLSMPATVPGPPLGMRLTMASMHVVLWAVTVGLQATLVSRLGRGSA